jgi:hypothetical protein
MGDILRRRKEQPQRRDVEYQSLAAWFDHMGNYHKLADFVIEHYSQEWALMLIDLLERQYLRFRGWLSREKRFASVRAGSASA